MTVIIKDKGWNRILKNLNEIDNSYVKIGLLGDSGSYEGDGSVNIAQVATWNEFGTSTIPSRPFMRQTFEKNTEVVNKLTLNLKGKIFAGQIGVGMGLETLGVAYKGLIQQQIRHGDFAPNADSTVVKKTVNGKKGNKPLIDTGQMVQSINYEVIK